MTRCPPPALIAPLPEILSKQQVDTIISDAKQPELEKYYSYVAKFLGEERPAPAKLIQSRRDHVLGKRGRSYIDTWDEEAYLHKEGYDNYGFEALKDWNDLFRNISDHHDGKYRDWHVFETPSWKKRLRDCKKDINIAFIPPPVAAALQHPACWGIGNRINPTSTALNTRLFHPAAYSTTTLDPPTKQTSTSNDEEVDDIIREWLSAQEELVTVESTNYIQLCKLHHYAAVASKLASIRSRRQRTHEVINDIYAFCKLQGFSYFDKRDTSKFDLCTRNGVSRPRPSISSSSIPNRSSSNVQTMCPPCKESEPFTELSTQRVDDLLRLRIGKLVEAFLDGEWVLAEIINLVYEGPDLRRIKVCLALGFGLFTTNCCF